MSVPCILVCDDTPAKRYVLASWLRRSGFEVVESSTVAEAGAVLAAQAVDLAVLDVHLPDGSGLDLTRAIRADPALASTPVVHVSAVARETADKVTALDEGADAYLVDPIEPEELLSTVRRLLRTAGARRDAELHAHRLARLNLAAVSLNGAGSVPRLVELATRAAGEIADGPAMTLLLDEQGTAWQAVAGTGDATTAAVVPPERAAGLGALLGPLGPDAAVLGAGSQWGDRLATVPGTWTGCAVRIAGAVEGVVAVPVVSTEDRHLLLLLQRLSQAVAVALENLRTLAFEHHVALTLQRSLLPAVLPEPAGLRVAARYRASQQHVEVGGDFFDVFEVGGHCFLVIGDVQGHSLEAAVVMAELRYSLRAYAYEGHDPSTVIDRLDELLVVGGSELIATASILVLDPERRTLSAVTAGHLDVLLARDGVVTRLAPDGPLLGAGVSGHRPALTSALEPGDRLVLYTDGLVERRDEPLDAVLERLGARVAAAVGTPDELADEVLAAWGESDDDIALLVVEVTAAPAVPGEPAESAP